MSDMARDAAIFERWVEGERIRDIAAAFKCGADFVLQVVDKFTVTIDDAMRRRLVGREISRLEEMYRGHFSKAKTDIASAQLCLAIAKRFADLVGLDAAQKLDVTQLPAEHESSTDRIERVLALVAGKHINGDGSPDPSTPAA